MVVTQLSQASNKLNQLVKKIFEVVSVSLFGAFMFTLTLILIINAAKIDDLKTRLTEEYELNKQQQLQDYPIFMAIAEEIGYDATGKKTATNELDLIGEELKKFIASL